MFVEADVRNWFDSAGHYWSVKDGGATAIGTRDERLSKHPKTQNDSDPWHGYPASPAGHGAGDAPEDNLIERWLGDDVVERPFARRLQRRRI